MHYALVNGLQTPPSPGLRGTCPSCGAEMIPKCGDLRVHHWAHHGIRSCDPWWEPETLWHRDWKNHFPIDWQEIARTAPSGEKHIADVLTAHGLTIEFQHSYLQPAERAAREAFYGNMFWVVDCTRLKRDLPRFEKGAPHFTRTKISGLFTTYFPEESFPAPRLICTVPVLFDFGRRADAATDILWCLLPQRIDQQAVVLALSRTYVLERIMTRAEPVPAARIFRYLAHEFLETRRAEIRRLHSQRPWWPRPRSARRYARF